MPGKTVYSKIAAYTTKDGSEIRELMHPARHAVTKQSLAEARVLVGGRTLLHRHQLTEELYHITQGQGRMTLGDQVFDVAERDSVCIPPGTPHCIENTGESELVLLCACAPAYAHEDTELLEAG